MLASKVDNMIVLIIFFIYMKYIFKYLITQNRCMQLLINQRAYDGLD